ncbi:Rrf2 family transcriptional regulator [Streptomyces sparsogenes]|uniref:RrF2 family transcriptional regulator n=1 Tax=Streptomyces sparsogenes TaxID=67365 RepID=UPI003321ADCA
MRISARADYGVRAALELAAAGHDTSLKAEAIAVAQGIPHKFLEGILGDLRRGGLVTSRRGGNCGYRLARPAGEMAIADVATATLPDEVLVLAEDPEAWTNPWPTPLSTDP